MKIEPLVSIIVSALDNEETLYECAESIIKQSYDNMEIILVIDATSDRVKIICSNLSLMDSRIKTVNFIRKKDSNENILFSSLYEGLKSATGSYVTFLDSSDKLHMDMVRTLTGVCIKYQCQIAACEKTNRGFINPFGRERKGKVVIYRKNAAFLSRRFPDELKGKLFDISLFNNFYPQPFTMYRLYYKAARLAYVDRVMYFERHVKINKENYKLQAKELMEHYIDRIRFFKDKEKALLELSHEYYCSFLAGYYIYKYKNGERDTLERVFSAFRREYCMIKYSKITPLHTKLQLGIFYRWPNFYVFVNRWF